MFSVLWQRSLGGALSLQNEAFMSCVGPLCNQIWFLSLPRQVYVGLHVPLYDYTSLVVSTQIYSGSHVLLYDYSSLVVRCHFYSGLHVPLYDYSSLVVRIHIYSGLHVPLYDYTTLVVSIQVYSGLHVPLHDYTSLVVRIVMLVESWLFCTVAAYDVHETCGTCYVHTCGILDVHILSLRV